MPALKTLSFRVNDFDQRRLDKVAAARGKKPTAIVRELVERYLDSYEAAQKKSA